jgi:hypothetical protein
MRKQYCIYTRDFPNCKGLFRDLRDSHIQYEPHINRTRFWLHSNNTLHQRFFLRYSHSMHCVDGERDHRVGQ